MDTRGILPLVFFGAAVSVLTGCDVGPQQPPSVVQEETLTPERAKEALLEMMRSRAGQDTDWFRGDVTAEMAKMNIEAEEGGWYAWTGAFRFHPAKGIYTFVVRPRPGASACAFEYKGSFVRQGRRWSATLPELVSTALQAGE
jgi:hypothetical protein